MASVDGQLSQTEETKRASLTRNQGEHPHQQILLPVRHGYLLRWRSNAVTHTFKPTWLKFSSVSLDFTWILQPIIFRNGGRSEGLNSCQLLFKAPPPQRFGRPRATRRRFSIKGRTTKRTRTLFAQQTTRFHSTANRILASVEVNTAASQLGGSGHVPPTPSFAPTLLNSRASRKTSGRLLLLFSVVVKTAPSETSTETETESGTRIKTFAVRNQDFIYQRKK